MTTCVAWPTPYCLVGEQAICLDIKGNRYFGLGRRASMALRRLSEHDQLSADESTALEHLERRGALHGVRNGRAGVPGCAGTETILDEPTAGKDWSVLPAVGWRLICARYRVRRGFAAALEPIVRYRSNSALKLTPDRDLLRLICSAYQRTDLVFPAHDNCLPRSLGLTEHLLRRGQDVRLYIGVMLRPFRAHCWVQQGSTLLNDWPETIRNFTPLLVL